MAPSKAPTSWDEDTSSGSDASSSPIAAPVLRRGKFDDEEDEDVLDDWEEEEDSEVEREKAKKAAAAKAKADAEAKAAHKSKSQRIEERIAEKQRKKQELFDEESDEDEDPGEAARRARAAEKESDLRNAEDLFNGVGGVPSTRGAKPVTVVDDAARADGTVIDLSSLSLFSPTSAPQFAKLRETLVPLLTANAKKPQYPLMLPQLVKELCKDLTSEQVKKVAGVLNTMSNEKMKEEKAAEKGGKKTKAAKTKASLVANRDVSRAADTRAYDGDDGLDDDDFM